MMILITHHEDLQPSTQQKEVTLCFDFTEIRYGCRSIGDSNISVKMQMVTFDGNYAPNRK
jgi:hypothetical protein